MFYFSTSFFRSPLFSLLISLFFLFCHGLILSGCYASDQNESVIHEISPVSDPVSASVSASVSAPANDEYPFAEDDTTLSATALDLGKMGFFWFPNSCFANAAMKLLWANTAVTSIIDPTLFPLRENQSSSGHELETRQKVQAELHTLFKKLNEVRVEAFKNLLRRNETSSVPSFSPSLNAETWKLYRDLYSILYLFVPPYMAFSYGLYGVEQLPFPVAIHASDFFSSWNHSISENAHFKDDLSRLYDRIEDYRALVNESGERYFYKDLSTDREYYLRKDQLDSQEFLGALLQMIEYSRYNGNAHLESVLHLDSGKKWISGEDESVRDKDTFTMLSVELEDSHNKPFQFISDAIRNAFSAERMVGDNALLNPDTGKTENGSHQFIIVADLNNLPEQIFIHLKRYKLERVGNSPNLKALKHSVKISREIDLEFWPEHITGARLESVAPVHVKMRPYGVVVHRGYSLNSGHYYAYIYDRELKVWFKHDDERVTLLKGEELNRAAVDMAENGYILLYGKNRD